MELIYRCEEEQSEVILLVVNFVYLCHSLLNFGNFICYKVVGCFPPLIIYTSFLFLLDWAKPPDRNGCFR